MRCTQFTRETLINIDNKGFVDCKLQASSQHLEEAFKVINLDLSVF